MSLLPYRYPQKDFFVLDIADVVPEDDTASIKHPIFSLATKPDMSHLEYRSGDSILKSRQSAKGLPTIFDKDILANGNPPINPSKPFVGYCKKLKKLGQLSVIVLLSSNTDPIFWSMVYG